VGPDPGGLARVTEAKADILGFLVLGCFSGCLQRQYLLISFGHPFGIDEVGHHACGEVNYFGGGEAFPLIGIG
jgi:hypothetical protein